MLLVKIAESLILDLIKPITRTETIHLDQSLNRILAEDIISEQDYPYWDNSAMDGYAVRYVDVKDAQPQQPITLEIVEEIPAGYQPQKTIYPQQAARIFTGGMMPDGADTIIIQENTQRQDHQVKIFSVGKPQDFVRHRASFSQAGDMLLPKGISLTEPDIAILATAQCTTFQVYQRLKVAIISTGDELINPHEALQLGKIIDSNQYALAAFIRKVGAIPIPMGIIPDEPAKLKEAIADAINSADVVLSTGGVSVGDYDYIDEILEELGATIHIRSVKIKPGKPLTVATFNNNCLYFGIPGNPVSALVSCWRFVQPAIKKLSGLTHHWLPQFITAKTCQDLKADGKRETYLWGQIVLINGRYEFTLAGGSHSSGNLINLAQTNGLAILPVDVTFIPQGAEVTIMQVNY